MVEIKNGNVTISDNSPKPQETRRPEQETQQRVDYSTKETSAQDIKYLNFGRFGSPIDLSRLRSGYGRENLIKIKNEIEKMLSSRNETKDFKVTLLDNSVCSDLVYSTMVFHTIVGNELYYYLVIFSSTGRQNQTVGQITSIINSSNDPSRFNEIWTTDDAINENYHAYVSIELCKEYGVNYGEQCPYRFIPLEGVIINETDMDTDVLTQRIYYNACSVFLTICILSENNSYRDLNMKQAIQNIGNRPLSIDTFYTSENTVGPMGDVYRTDFIAKLVYKPNSKTFTPQQLNSFAERDEVITSVGGFIDLIPTLRYDQVSRANVWRFKPHIIITRFDLEYPTTNYFLTSILSSLVMIEKSQIVASIYHGPIVDPGSLNLMAKIDGDKPTTTLRGPKDSPEAAAEFIADMLIFEPVISIDIPHYNDSSNFLSNVFGCAKGRKEAGTSFINSIYNMTEGAFSDTFDPNQVFDQSGVTIPLGYWMSKNGKRDLRDVDVPFILSNTKTNDYQLANIFAASNLPNSGMGDPYLVKLDIISKFIPDAVITGKGTRLTFTNKFINEFQRAANDIGFVAIHKPSIEFYGNKYNAGMINDYYNRFSLNGSQNIIRSGIQTINNFTNYSTFGRM